MKKILLTGSSGYIATNFFDLNHQKYDFIFCDKKDNKDVLNLKRQDIDCIIHLAAISGIKQCEQDYDQTINDNILTVEHLSKIYPDKHIIFASSQSVKTPNNTYSLTKKIGENIIKSKFDKYSILRFANIYGGHSYFNKKTSVVSNFINAKKQGKPLIINGNGEQTRDFIHVFDICNAINLAIENGPINTCIDIGTGKETKINELANMISSNFLKTYKNGGTSSNVADIKKATKLIGFIPKINLNEFIKGLLKD